VGLVLDVLGEDLEAVDLAARREAIAATLLSPRSEMSRALPAVSTATIGLMPSFLMMRRHWPSAWTWLSTLLMSASLVPLIAINDGGSAKTIRRR